MDTRFKKTRFKTNLFKEWMKKFVAQLTKKTRANNEWENDDSVLLWALYSIGKKIRSILFPYLLTCLNKGTSLMLQAANTWTC